MAPKIGFDSKIVSPPSDAMGPSGLYLTSSCHFRSHGKRRLWFRGSSQNGKSFRRKEMFELVDELRTTALLQVRQRRGNVQR
jgi:hypothetical protein